MLGQVGCMLARGISLAMGLCMSYTDVYSWNKRLARQRAIHLGYEYRQKGVNVALSPVVGPIGRVAEGGRNWEGFSADPYQSGVLVYETVEGMQSTGVGACTKVS